MVANYRVDESFLARVDSIKEIDSLRLALNDLHLWEDLLTVERVERLHMKRSVVGPPGLDRSTRPLDRINRIPQK